MPVTFKGVEWVDQDEKSKLMHNFSNKYQALYDEMYQLSANRALSLALTKLEESAMWLNKSITENY
jgi:hypothetical protein